MSLSTRLQKLLLTPKFETFRDVLIIDGVEIQNNPNSVRGSGVLVSRRVDLPAFTAIEIGGVFDSTVIVGGTESYVVVHADDNLLDKIRLEVRNGCLAVYPEGNISTVSRWKLEVFLPSLQSLETSGSCSVRVGRFHTDKLRLSLSGVSSCTLTGAADLLEAELSGASKLVAKDFQCNEVDIDTSGASHAEVFVLSSLEADASGASSVTYKGNPQTRRTNTSGVGSVRSVRG